jgi:glycine betaine catabolism B
MCGLEGFMKAAQAMASETAIVAQYKESFGEKIIVEETDGLGGEVYFSLSGNIANARPARPCSKRR